MIYRTNQAFEGMLKEAYTIINGSIPNNITPYKIEKYFEDNNVLEERVLQLFTNYRTEWRNKSTHDYKLYFSEQESFLAIVNISAFINILLDQMVEKKAYDTEVEILKSLSTQDIKIPKSVSLLDRTISFLEAFSKEIPSRMSGTVIPRITEREILGSLNAYINNFAPDITIHHEYKISMGSNIRYVDLLLEYKKEKLIIEIKNSRQKNGHIISMGTEQLLSYLIASNINKGILYIPPYSISNKLEISKINRKVGDNSYEIIQIYPS